MSKVRDLSIQSMVCNEMLHLGKTEVEAYHDLLVDVMQQLGEARAREAELRQALDNLVSLTRKVEKKQRGLADAINQRAEQNPGQSGLRSCCFEFGADTLDVLTGRFTSLVRHVHSVKVEQESARTLTLTEEGSACGHT